MKRTILTLLLLLSPAFTLAAPSTYQIEVIVFQRLDSKAVDDAGWHAQDAPLDMREFNVPYTRLPSVRFTLNSEAKRLEDSSKFRVLSHIAWRQRFEFDDEPQAMPLIAGNQETPVRLFGTVKVSLNKYFKVQAQMDLERKVNNWLQRDQTLYTFNQSRKLRSGQLNYLDSPVLGMLVKIVPLSHRERG